MTGSMAGSLTIELIAAGLVTLAAAAVSGLGWLYRRIGRLETQMAQRTSDDEAQQQIMASRDDVHEIAIALERLNGRLETHEEADKSLGRSIDELRDRVTDLRSAVQRIDDYLRKSGT